MHMACSAHGVKGGLLRHEALHDRTDAPIATRRSALWDPSWGSHWDALRCWLSLDNVNVRTDDDSGSAPPVLRVDASWLALEWSTPIALSI